MPAQHSSGRGGAVALLLIPVLLIGLVLSGVILITGSTPAACNLSGRAVTVDPTSVPEGPIAGYGHEQLVNAAYVMVAAEKLSLTVRDQQIGVMTAMGESGLRILDYGDGAGPDSRGLFQQRDNGAWGTYQDRMDPFVSSTNFFKVELTIQGRETMAPTLVANAVQRNADPYHYEPYWQPAGIVVQALAGVKPIAPGPAPAPGDTGNSYSLGPVQPVTATVANTLGPMFGFKTIGGYRDSNTRDREGHPAGLALDFMTNDIANGRSAGQQLADYLVANAGDVGVKYIIWEQHIWSVARADEGWRLMEDRGSPTQNHMDHVHLSLDANAAGVTPESGCQTRYNQNTTGWTHPSDGPLGSPYGWRVHPVYGTRKFHYGQDMGPGCNAPIWSVNNGLVITAGPRGGFGHLIEVDHGNGVVSRYGHMYSDGVLARVGDQVTSGQQIGRIGSDGVSTGCHLHFEVRINGENVDPMAFLRQNGVEN